MKPILIAGAVALAAGGQALAADLPQPPPPAQAPAAYYRAPEPIFAWTGFYLGINGGYAFGSSTWSSPGLLSSTNSPDGFLVGGTIGGNYQFNQFVLGIEADGDWTNFSGTTSSNSCFTFGCTTQSDWLATVRGRAGFAWDRILFYGTFGGAFGDLRASSGSLPWTNSTQVGWTAGGGIEAALSPNWSVKVEYLYVDLGNMSCPTGSCGAPTTVSLTENVIRAGINYKFSWGY